MNKEYLITLQNLAIKRKAIYEMFFEKNDNFQASDKKEFYEYLKDKCNNYIKKNNMKKMKNKIEIPNYEEYDLAYNKALDTIDKCEKENVFIITLESEKYPKLLKTIDNKPLILYAKGNLELLNDNDTVAVIGTREPTEKGKIFCERITEIFVKNDLTIVSGLALGCDSIAHKTCINKNGYTIGVLAHGLDYMYPRENIELSREIINKNGLLISEYTIGEKPKKYFFVERDRIQSGISKAICIIETNEKGGTMHTAEHAKNQKRIIGCIYVEALKDKMKISGNIKLIEEKVAYKLSNADDIANFIKLIKKNRKDKSEAKANIEDVQLSIFL